MRMTAVATFQLKHGVHFALAELRDKNTPVIQPLPCSTRIDS